jgi:hypothetical protein
LAKARGSNVGAKRQAGRAAVTRASSAADLVKTGLIGSFIDKGGHVVIQRVADSFGMSKGQLAETMGLARETLHKTARINAAKTQSRAREMLEIVSRICVWAGGKDQAMAWYRAQPIAAFGDRTAESLVKSGQAAAVRDYLDHLALGGFA